MRKAAFGQKGWEKLCMPPIQAWGCGREWPINLRLWEPGREGAPWIMRDRGCGAARLMWGMAASIPSVLLKRFPTRSSACRFRHKFVQRSVITLPETWFDFLPSLSYLAQRRFKPYQIMKCYPLYSARISADGQAARAQLQVASDCKFPFWKYFLPDCWLER